ncbi:oligosaccharide flippase family protein [Chloroflexota bacterium]
MSTAADRAIKSLFSNYLHLISGNILIQSAIGFLTLLLIVRVLQPDNYGVYVLFGAVGAIAAILTTWTSASIVRFGREEFIAEGSVKKTFWANYAIILPAFALCFLLLFIFRATLTRYIGISESFYYLIFAFILVTNLSGNIPVAFQAMGRIKPFTYLPQISNGIWLVVLAVIYFQAIAVSVELLISILISTHLFVVVFGLWLLRKDILPLYVSKEWLKKCFKYSYPLAFGNVGTAIIGNVDQILIGIFMPVVFVGIYNIAYKIQDYIFGLPNLSRSLMFPLMTSLVVTGQTEKINRYMKSYVPQIVFFWSLILSLFMVFGREIMLIFGQDYVAAFLPFSILLAASGLRIFYVIESPILSSHSLTKEIAGMAIATAIINLGLDYLLIPIMGISGAAVATSISLVVIVIMRSFVVKRKTGINDFVNYPWIFPALLSLGAIFIDSLPSRSILLLAVVIVSLLVAKKSAIFNRDSLTIMDTIDMPVYVRRTVKAVYSLLI